MLFTKSEIMALRIDEYIFIMFYDKEQQYAYRYNLGGSEVLGWSIKKTGKKLIFEDGAEFNELYVDAYKKYHYLKLK